MDIFCSINVRASAILTAHARHVLTLCGSITAEAPVRDGVHVGLCNACLAVTRTTSGSNEKAKHY
jgi:hypothetical protein